MEYEEQVETGIYVIFMRALFVSAYFIRSGFERVTPHLHLHQDCKRILSAITQASPLSRSPGEGQVIFV